MFAAACRVIAALAIVAVPLVAVAQVIPPSEQPGRQRERFEQPTRAASEPAGPRVTLPSTVAPKGAEKIFVRVRGVHITGSTIYSKRAASAAVCELSGPSRFACDDLRTRAAHHRQIRQRRLRAVARHRAAAGAQSQEARSFALRSSKATSTRSSGRRSCRAIAISSPPTPRRSRPSGRSTSAPSSAICCSPAICPGLKFSTSLQAVCRDAAPRCSSSRSTEKPIDSARRRSTTAARRRGGRSNISARRRSTTCSDNTKR